jgi:hypothetical protein
VTQACAVHTGLLASKIMDCYKGVRVCLCVRACVFSEVWWVSCVWLLRVCTHTLQAAVPGEAPALCTQLRQNTVLRVRRRPRR